MGPHPRPHSWAAARAGLESGAPHASRLTRYLWPRGGGLGESSSLQRFTRLSSIGTQSTLSEHLVAVLQRKLSSPVCRLDDSPPSWSTWADGVPVGAEGLCFIAKRVLPGPRPNLGPQHLQGTPSGSDCDSEGPLMILSHSIVIHLVGSPLRFQKQEDTANAERLQILLISGQGECFCFVLLCFIWGVLHLFLMSVMRKYSSPKSPSTLRTIYPSTSFTVSCISQIFCDEDALLSQSRKKILNC